MDDRDEEVTRLRQIYLGAGTTIAATILVACMVIHRRVADGGWSDFDIFLLSVQSCVLGFGISALLYSHVARRTHRVYEEILRKTIDQVPEMVVAILRELQQKGLIDPEITIGDAVIERTKAPREKMN